jgi:hypothetical protein
MGQTRERLFPPASGGNGRRKNPFPPLRQAAISAPCGDPRANIETYAPCGDPRAIQMPLQGDRASSPMRRPQKRSKPERLFRYRTIFFGL